VKYCAAPDFLKSIMIRPMSAVTVAATFSTGSGEVTSQSTLKSVSEYGSTGPAPIIPDSTSKTNEIIAW